MAAAKRKPAAKKPAAKKPAAKKCGAASNMRRDRASPVPAQVAREEAGRQEEPQEVACGVRTRFLCYSHDAFTSRPAPKKATPKKPAAKSPKKPVKARVLRRSSSRHQSFSAQAAKKSPAKPAAKPAAKKCAGGVETAPSPRVDVSLAQVAREAGFEGQVAGQEEEPRQETGLEGEESCKEEDGRQEVARQT